MHFIKTNTESQQHKYRKSSILNRQLRKCELQQKLLESSTSPCEMQDQGGTMEEVQVKAVENA